MRLARLAQFPKGRIAPAALSRIDPPHSHPEHLGLSRHALVPCSRGAVATSLRSLSFRTPRRSRRSFRPARPSASLHREASLGHERSRAFRLRHRRSRLATLAARFSGRTTDLLRENGENKRQSYAVRRPDRPKMRNVPHERGALDSWTGQCGAPRFRLFAYFLRKSTAIGRTSHRWYIPPQPLSLVVKHPG